MDQDKKEVMEVDGGEDPVDGRVEHKCTSCQKKFSGFYELHGHVTETNSPCRLNRSLWTHEKSTMIVKTFKAEISANQGGPRRTDESMPAAVCHELGLIKNSPNTDRLNNREAMTSDMEVAKRFNSAQLLDKVSAGENQEFRTDIYYLVLRCCRKEIKVEKVINLIRKIACEDPKAASLISDIFGALNVSLLFACPKDDTARATFSHIMKSCSNVLKHVLQERIDQDTLFNSGTFPGGQKMYNTKFIRIKTRLFFKQNKFNLLREESEGYAKLLSELCRPSKASNPLQITKQIQCLIGRFNLDPNRVLDIIIQGFEAQPNCNYFITLILKLNPPSNTICELIGSRLQIPDSYSYSLFLVIAHLLQHRIIKLEQIYPWLTPDDRTIHRQWARQIVEAKEYARKSMIVTINKENVEEAEEVPPSDDLYFDNHKFCLCEALIHVGCFDVLTIVLEKLPEPACFSNKRMALRLMDVLQYLIHPMYSRVNTTKGTSDHNRLKPEIPIFKTNSKAPKQFKSYEDMHKFFDLFLMIGPYIHFNPGFMYRMLRLMKFFMVKHSAPPSTPLYYKFLTLLDQVILPGLSFLESNCAVSEEIWTVMKLYPYQFRYRMYAAWKGESILLQHPTLLRRRVDLVKRVKHLMRRISKENVKQMGRSLGKLSHTMPAVVFDYLLSQIQLFDNLTMPVIDALKFLTSLSYDVLGHSLLEALSPSPNKRPEGFSVMLLPNRPRTKHDGSTIAPWLQSLASFAGAMCKKYSMELVPLLQYVANQLKSKQSLDLLLLKEIVQKMTGIEAAEEMTTEQLEAMGGGDLLRGEAGYFGQVRTAKKSGNRLREASSSNNLAVALCILMAQQRDSIVFNEATNLHTKLVGKLHDQCQDTLVQFGSFLAVSGTLDDYAKKIPPLKNLVEDYHVSSDVAYFLWRPLFAQAIQVKYDELRRAIDRTHKMTTQERYDKYADAANIVLNPIADVMKKQLSPKTWEDISPQFYVTFWSLTLYDLLVPTEAYNREISRIKALASVAAENKDLTSSKRKREVDRCNALIDKLREEMKRQREHVDRVMAKLNKEKDSWFAQRQAKSAKNEAVTAFLQLCLFPRCIFTAPDALYCAHFVNIIHSLSTPNFSTLICYDRIFCDVIYTITSCTENEANRYGRFLCALMGTVMKWHSDKSVFDKECASFPGFITKFRAANYTNSGDNSDHVEYENYRHVCHKWHYKITKSIIVCLESKDFTQIRNSLIVLKRILPYYPKVLNLATAVERWVERVRSEQKDKRQDLFALATSYIGQLKSRWNTITSEEEFHIKNSGPEKTPAENKAPKTPETKANHVNPEESKGVKTVDPKAAKPDKTPETRKKGLELAMAPEPKINYAEMRIPKKVIQNSDKTDRVSELRKPKTVKSSPESKSNSQEDGKTRLPDVKFTKPVEKQQEKSPTVRKARGADSQDSPKVGASDSKRVRLDRSPPREEPHSPSRKSRKKKVEVRSHTRSYK